MQSSFEAKTSRVIIEALFKDCYSTSIHPGNLVQMLPTSQPNLLTPHAVETYETFPKLKGYFLFLRDVTDEYYSVYTLSAKKKTAPILEILYHEKVYWICCNTAFMRVRS